MKVSVIVPVYQGEKYIIETLESIKEQTLEDFECLIINDGSTDNTQALAEDFCASDSRFHVYYKENAGVSSARNYGLDKAAGDYVLFVDGDDLITKKALEALYRKVIENNAEMSIGGMREFGAYGMPVYGVTQKLAKKDEIDRFDPLILQTFSVCNKMLKRSVIVEHNIRFENLKHAEDGLFLFTYLGYTHAISGCGLVMYWYRKRPFWQGVSATQSIDAAHFYDLLASLKIIEQRILENVEQEIENAKSKDNDEFKYYEETKARLDEYVSHMYSRFINNSLINGYYRYIWKSDKEICDIICNSIDEYKKELFPSMWQKIVDANKDLMMEKGLLSREELVKKARITIIVSNKVGAENIENIIYSILNQNVPAIRVLVQGELKDSVVAKYGEIECIEYLGSGMSNAEFKNEALNEAKSPYVYFIDDPMYLSINTLRTMYNQMEQQDAIDFVSGRIKIILENGDSEDFKEHSINFYKHCKDNLKYKKLDLFFSNKLFRRTSLVKEKIKFGDNPKEDIWNMFTSMKYGMLKKAFVFSTVGADELLRGARTLYIRLNWKRDYKKGIFETPNEKKKYLKDKAVEKNEKSLKWKMFFIRLLPVRKKVLFVSVRSNHLLENLGEVYDKYDGKKKYFSRVYPHTTKDKIGLYLQMFTSKVIVTDDYFMYFRMFKLKPNQKIIQIWHACGAFKKFGLDYASADIMREKNTHYQYDTVAVSSEHIRKDYAHAFGIPEDRIKALGVPRTDKLLSEEYKSEVADKFYSEYPELNNKKIVLYAPTFREDKTRRVRLKTNLNWRKLSKNLDKDTVIIIKNHPVMRYDLLKGKKFKNIINMPFEDTSTLMIVCDVMVTDYSSVIFEGALLKKPLVFYCPDFDTYERDFYLDFPKDTYGVLTVNQEELTKAISEAKLDKAKLDEFVDRYLSACDGNSTARVIECIKEKLNEK